VAGGSVKRASVWMARVGVMCRTLGNFLPYSVRTFSLF